MVNWTAPIPIDKIDAGVDVRGDISEYPNPWKYCPTINFIVKAVSTSNPSTGDGNNDGNVNLIDLSILLSDFNKTGNIRNGIDMNGDGVINTFDFGLMRNLLVQKGVIRG